jgi:hypothetical protein
MSDRNYWIDLICEGFGCPIILFGGEELTNKKWKPTRKASFNPQLLNNQIS